MADQPESSTSVAKQEEEKTSLLKIKLKSSDGKEIVLDEDVARKSKFLSDMIDLTDADQDRLNEPLVIDNHSADTLKKVFEWCTMTRGKQGRVKNVQEPRITLIKEEIEYTKISNAELVNVLLCANYLDIGELIEIITQRIANKAEGKTPEEMRKLFMLPDDFTEEEKEEIRKRHEWCDLR